MKKFKFTPKAAKSANTANTIEKQELDRANDLLTVAKTQGAYTDEQAFLASISGPLATSIYNKNKYISKISKISRPVDKNVSFDDLPKIEAMALCLHGKACNRLNAPGGRRPICSKADAPVFDLEACPLHQWARQQPRR